MTGLRERKKQRTRQVIAEVALRLFAERGFEAVTVNEVAEAAGVAKVTLFKYFPTKESLVLHAVADDTAGVVAGRAPGQSPLDALREHYRAFAAEPGGVDPEGLVTLMRVIAESPALTAGVNGVHYGQRQALAQALSEEGRRRWPAGPGEDRRRPDAPGEDRCQPDVSEEDRARQGLSDEGPVRCAGPGEADDLTPHLMAAQISAALLTIQEAFFVRLASGMPVPEAGRRLAADVELAFELLERGFGDRHHF
jgi:AcrR family transcriptional regulator